MVSEEKLSWMSSDTAFLAESGSSRPEVQVEMLQRMQGREGNAQQRHSQRGPPSKQPSPGAAT